MGKPVRTRRSRGRTDTTILIVSSDPLVVDTLERIVPAGMRCAASVTRGLARATLAASHPFHGLVLDVPLADGVGFDVLDEFGAKFPDAPVVVTTNFYKDPQFAIQAFDRRARFRPWPFGAETFGVFMADVQAFRWGVPHAIAPRFAAWVVHHRLTDGQGELSALYVRKLPRPWIAKELGIRLSTLTTREEQLRRKLGVKSLDTLYDRVMGT